jgi:hypothetical protein
MQNFQSSYQTNSSTIPFGLKEIGPYYWVGHCDNGINYYAGQTFVAPETGLLKKISLFPSIVYGTTDATLALYEFDNINHTWKQKRAETHRLISKAMEGNWVDFELPNLRVDKNRCYAFRLSCNSGGMVAIAECPWSTPNPYADGEEWIASSQSPDGNFHKDFDLAFQGEIEPSLNTQFI